MNAAVTESDHKSSLNDQLRDKFHLKTEPFGDATSLFFQGAQRQHNLETLRHLVSYGDMVLLLTGASGSGKTTLIAELGKSIVDGVRIVSLNPTLIASPRKLALELCKRLDLQQVEGEPISRSMGRILEACAENSAAGERLLLVVDDAHKINKESFKLLLSTFRGLGADSGICLLVSGRQEILQSITQEGVDPATCSWMHQIHLKPFSQEDAETYVSLRLIRAGSKVEPIFTEAQKKALYELGKGCPGRINRIAPGVLLDSFEIADPQKKASSGLSWLLVGVVASLLVSFVVIGFQYNLFSSSSGDASALINEDERVLADSIRDEKLQADLLAQSRAEINQRIEQAEIKAGSLPRLDKLIDDRDAALIEDADDTLPELDTEGNSPGVNMPSIDVAGEAVYTSDGILQPNSIVADTPEVEKVNASAQLVAETQSKITDGAGVNAEKADSIKPVKKIVSEALLSSRHPHFRDESWLSAQKKGSYTIQVLGSRNEQTAVKYIDGERSTKELLYIESTYKDKPWFVVILGVYPNKAMARTEMGKLPTSIKKQKPWVRSLEGL